MEKNMEKKMEKKNGEKNMEKKIIELVAENIRNGVYVVNVENANRVQLLAVDGFLNMCSGHPDLEEGWRDYCQENSPWEDFNRTYCDKDGEIIPEKFQTPAEIIIRDYVVNARTGEVESIDEQHSVVVSEDGNVIVDDGREDDDEKC